MENDYEFAHYEGNYTVWILAILILILIAIIAVVFALDDLSRTLQKKVIIPIKEKVDSIESKFASIEARAGDIGDRIQGWDQMLKDAMDQETIEKGKLALDNLAFGLMELRDETHRSRAETHRSRAKTHHHSSSGKYHRSKNCKKR